VFVIQVGRKKDVCKSGTDFVVFFLSFKELHFVSFPSAECIECFLNSLNCFGY